MKKLTFTLPYPLLLPNRRGLPANRAAAAAAIKKERVMMAMEIAALLAGIRPVEPIQYARVWVFRHSTGQEPDRDNFNAACKGLLDVLQPSTAKRSYGLGVIENDKPGRCDLRIHHVHAKHSTQQMTRVIITEIDAAEIDAVRAAVAKEAEQAASLIGVHGAPLGLDKDASAKALAAA